MDSSYIPPREKGSNDCRLDREDGPLSIANAGQLVPSRILLPAVEADQIARPGCRTQNTQSVRRFELDDQHDGLRLPTAERTNATP